MKRYQLGKTIWKQTNTTGEFVWRSDIENNYMVESELLEMGAQLVEEEENYIERLNVPEIIIYSGKELKNEDILRMLLLTMDKINEIITHLSKCEKNSCD